MFETAVIRAQAQTARGRFSVLTASVVAHSAIILGALAMSIASVDFPATSPDEYSRARVFIPLTVPPPLGTPDGGGAKREAQPVVKPLPAPTQPTAPSTVPDTVPETPVSGTSESSIVDAEPGTGTGDGPIGVPWGVKDSIGSLDAPPVPVDTPVAQPEAKIYEAHEVKAPVLLSRVDPRYPQTLIRTGMPGIVVVRCVIDRNGNLREPQILTATNPAFEGEVRRVIGQWKYRPATLSGRPVDSYLNLTVNFSVRR
jgi:periplasmic protein TonB